MTKFLKSIDRVGRPFTFNIEGEDSYRTPAGGIISIFYYIGIIVFTFYFGRDLWQKEDPNFIQRIEIEDNYPFLNFDQSNFFTAIKVLDSRAGIYNLSYFDMELRYVKFDYKNGDFSFGTPIPHEKCSEKHLAKEPLLQMGLNEGAYCFNLNYTIGGYWDNDLTITPIMVLRRCNKNTELMYNIKCVNDQELMKIYPALYIEIYYLNHLINPRNFSVPYKDVYHMNYEQIDITQSNSFTFEMFYNHANLTTDAGIIFEESYTESFIEFYSFRKIMSHFHDLGDYVMMINVFISKKISYYNRTYIRLPDVLANTGGFMDLTLVCVNFFFSFYLDNSYTVFLYKKLFKLEIEEDSSNSIDKNKNIPINIELNKLNEINHIENELSLKDNSNSNLHDENEKKSRLFKLNGHRELNPFNKDLNKIINYKKKKRTLVKITYCERTKYLYCCNNSSITANNLADTKQKEQAFKNELIKIADSIIDRKSDLFILWKTIDQFNLMKKLFFQENQCYMLNKIGLKEIIINSDNFFTNKEANKLEKELESIKKLIEYFKSKKEKKKTSDIDTILFHYMDDDLKAKIEQQ